MLLYEALPQASEKEKNMQRVSSKKRETSLFPLQGREGKYFSRRESQGNSDCREIRLNLGLSGRFHHHPQYHGARQQDGLRSKPVRPAGPRLSSRRWDRIPSVGGIDCGDRAPRRPGPTLGTRHALASSHATETSTECRWLPATVPPPASTGTASAAPLAFPRGFELALSAPRPVAAGDGFTHVRAGRDRVRRRGVSEPRFLNLAFILMAIDKSCFYCSVHIFFRRRYK